MIESGQQSNILIWVAVISALSAIASALAVGIVNYRGGKELERYRFNNIEVIEKQKIQHMNELEKQKNDFKDKLERNKIINIDCQRKQQVYSQLMGRKSMILQSYASYYGEFIRSEYLDYRSRITAISRIDHERIRRMMPDQANIEFNKIVNIERENSLEFKSSEKADHMSRDLRQQIGKGNERLWMTIGLIQVIFSNTEDLKKLIKQIIEEQTNFEELEKHIIADIETVKEEIAIEAGYLTSNEIRDQWFKDRSEKSQNWLKTYYDKSSSIQESFELSIDALLYYIERELQKANEVISDATPAYIEIEG